MQNQPNYLYICSGMEPASPSRGKPSRKRHSPDTRASLTKKGIKTVPQKKPGKQSEADHDSGKGVRLNRYIANSGLCSRREADELIRSGLIQVNGRTVSEFGTRVSADDSVSYRGKPIGGERKVYVLLNKPRDCLTTVKDTHGRQTVMDLVRDCCPERIYPVGRLDRNTTGLLLLTNDGELAESLSHPSYNREKIYHIHLERPLETGDMERLAEGFELEDGFIRPDRIDYADPGDSRQVGLEIHSGRNRIVRRMFEHLGYRVLRLDRVYYAGLTKKGLPRGHWRHLSQKEVNMLKMSVPRRKPGKKPEKP